jgi:opacity protein-like surface antigen
MRKLITIALALTVIAAAAPAEAGFGLKVRGGYTYITYSDFNDWVDATNNEIPSGSPTLDNMKWVPEGAAEFTFPLMPSVSGAVGIGYLSGKADYSVSFGGDGFSYVHKVKSMPLTFNIYWDPPMVSIKPFAFGGVGFYRTNLEFEYWITSGGEQDGYSAELDKWGFGVQGGGGVSFGLMPTMSLDVGVQARWASISGFEGTAERSDGEKIDVYLANYDGYFGPEQKGVGEPEGTVDLSGFTFFVGLTFGF